MCVVLLYRRIRYGYPFRKIPLTKGQYAIVDPEDYYELTKYNWQADKAWRTSYARRRYRSPQKGRKYVTVLMHRQIMKAPHGIVIDHINFNGLDNRKANLRRATYAQNNYHRRKRRNCAQSAYKGVSRAKGEKPWRALITCRGKTTCLGLFEDEKEAAKAYDKAARKYHKEFAALNFPDKKG